MVEAQTAEQKNKKTHVYSNPVFKQILKVNSYQAQRVMSRKFERVKNALFNMDAILPLFSKQQTEMDEIERIIQEDMENIKQDLNKDEAQFTKLIEDYGIERRATYTHPSAYEIEITSPKVADFAELIKKLDTLIGLIDTLWIPKVLHNKQRNNAVYQWQQRLLKLADRITGIEKRARAAAHAQGKSLETHVAASEDDYDKEEGSPEAIDEEPLQENEVEEVTEQ